MGNVIILEKRSQITGEAGTPFFYWTSKEKKEGKYINASFMMMPYAIGHDGWQGFRNTAFHVSYNFASLSHHLLSSLQQPERGNKIPS